MQMSYTKYLLQIIILMIVHVSYYYTCQAVQSLSQPQRAVFQLGFFTSAPATTAFHASAVN